MILALQYLITLIYQYTVHHLYLANGIGDSHLAGLLSPGYQLNWILRYYYHQFGESYLFNITDILNILDL
jgi:hypothetical protein